MSLGIECIPFRGWANALRLDNGSAEIVATLDVGPRILSYSLRGGVNPLNIYDDQAGGVGEPQWRNRGGHRLWLAPESQEFSYFPDNSPVAWQKLGDWGVRLMPPAEPGPGFRKEIDITMQPQGPRVTVTHRIIRTADSVRLAAPWALSVMAAGGMAIIPQPPLGQHPRDLLPNRRWVLWPYSDPSDPRFRFGRRFVTLRQDAQRGPNKIGFASREGWAGYLYKGTLFTKRFGHDEAHPHPDDGCNLEVFTNARMLELETLGPLRPLGKGQSTEWTEQWDLIAGQPDIDPADAETFENHFLLAQEHVFSKT
jgi:hypothetical protein